jgi:hypothetical protein
MPVNLDINKKCTHYYISVEQSHTSVADTRSSGQKIPSLVWNPKVHYTVRKSQPTGNILINFNPVHTLIYYLFKINLNIIIQRMPTFLKWPFTFRFPD